MLAIKTMYRTFVFLVIVCFVNSENYRENVTDISLVTTSSPGQGSDKAVNETLVTLEEILHLYDPAVVRRFGVGSNLTVGCLGDMLDYVTGLEEQQIWALKMLDATGRYSAGYFWGNNYWLGSATSCRNIALAPKHYTQNISIQGSKLDHGKQTMVPFDVGYYRVRLMLHFPLDLPSKRIIHLGLCLPMSCTAGDIQHILNEAKTIKKDAKIFREVEIHEIKTPHNMYIVWRDPVFWIVVTITAVIWTLLFMGTAYDIYIHKQKFRFSNTATELSVEDQRQININITNNLKKSNVNYISNVLQRLRGSNYDINSTNSTSESDQSSVQSNTPAGIWHEVLLSFSVRINMKTICDQSVGSDTIPTIHGLRSLSMAWVILGHTCITTFKYSDNMEFRTVVEKEFLFQTVSNGVFSVDTFFFISGLLVSFLYFRTTAKIDIRTITGTTGVTSNILEFFGLLTYRFFRLTAPYMYILGTVLVSMKWFYYNSVFDPPTDDHVNCANYWWRNLLYINTLFPVNEMCMIWSWYLADDTQFYVLGIILLITASRKIKLASFLLGFFVISSWLTTAYIAYVNNHSPSQDDPLALFDKIYDKPWTRLGPYLIGMAVGYYLFKTDCKIKMNKIVVVLGWALSMASMLSLVYGLHDAKLGRVMSAVYSSLCHSLWALGLSWIVIACSAGYGGYINKILSTSLLYPFSRVTYCAYLIHPMVIRYMVIENDGPIHLSKVPVMIMFLGQVSASYILSFIVSLAFEAPLVSLLRITSPKKH